MSTAIPSQRPTDSATRFQADQFTVMQLLLQMQTCSLVRVNAVYGGGLLPCTIDCTVLVDMVNGASQPTPHVPIYGRPVFRLHGGSSALIVDPQVGDVGVMIFASRDSSAALVSRLQGPPPSGRSYDYSDGIYLGAIPPLIPPAQYVWLSSAGIQIVSPTTVSVTAPAIALTGSITVTGAVHSSSGSLSLNGAQISTAGEVTDGAGVALGTHVHSGVTGGSADTGPPT